MQRIFCAEQLVIQNPRSHPCFEALSCKVDERERESEREGECVCVECVCVCVVGLLVVVGINARLTYA